MKLYFLVFATALLFIPTLHAAEFRNVTCEGTYPHHLQGICADKEAIYWVFTTTLVKTDLDGKLLKKVPVANHHGDLCFHDGKLYVAVNLGKFNDSKGNADSWVYVYDAATLKELARHEVQEVFHGAGGIGIRNGHFFVVSGLPDGVEENYVYEYDDKFKFIQKHVVKSGHTHLGIQTATFANDRWWFGCYGDPKILLITDADFKMKGRYEYDCSLGIVGLPDGRFLSASGRCEKQNCTGTVKLAIADDNSGLKLTEAPESLNVMTWNIRYDNPSDGVNAWPNRKDWVAEIVVKNNSDIAGFQEVLVGQLTDLKMRLPEMDAYGVGRDDGKNAGEFSPIFWRKDRFELIDKSTFWLSPTPETIGSKGWDAALPRIASWVKLKDRRTGIDFFVVNTHFDHRGSQARIESASLLLKRLKEQFADYPVILTGDFNTKPNSTPYNTLIGTGTQDRQVFLDAYDHSAQKPEGPNSTWNGFQAIVPDQRIDFVFVAKSVNVKKVRIISDQREGRFPSDHLPVVTELELMKE